VRNPELATVLREVRDGGAAAFYDPAGTISPAIAARAAARLHLARPGRERDAGRQAPAQFDGADSGPGPDRPAAPGGGRGRRQCDPGLHQPGDRRRSRRRAGSQAAINQGHWSGQEITSNCGGVTGPRSEVEAGTPAADLLAGLLDLHHPCARATELRSGSTAIVVGRTGLTGAADPRRDGAAVGD
jgi:hypothetical protein